MTALLGRHAIGRRVALALAVSLMFAAALGVRTAAAQAAVNTVRLVVDYGDGTTKTINNLAWAKGNTVLDAMKGAAARPHGISFSYSGSGDGAILNKIDDVQNEGAGKRNWQYWVNASYGDRSFAVFELHAGDVVTWRFATEQKQ